MGSYTTTNNWIQIQLTGTESNRSGIGGRVEIVADGHTQVQEVRCGSSYCVQNSFILNFGLGESEIVNTITVKWPSGIIDRLENNTPNQLINIIEGSESIIIGDVNADGFLDLLDIIITIEIIIDEADLDEYQLETADVNNDSSIDIFDIILMVELILSG